MTRIVVFLVCSGWFNASVIVTGFSCGTKPPVARDMMTQADASWSSAASMIYGGGFRVVSATRTILPDGLIVQR